MPETHITLDFNEQHHRWEARFQSKNNKFEILASAQDRDRVINAVQDESAWVNGGAHPRKIQRFYKNGVTITFDPVFESKVANKTYGGLRSNQSSQDELAAKTDKDLRRIVPEVWKAFKAANKEATKGFYHRPGWKNHEMNAIGLCEDFGIAPDGGIIFNITGVPVMAFEAKKQGTVGNAFERWFKNFDVLTTKNSDVAVVTFLAGHGVGLDKKGKPCGMKGNAAGAMTRSQVRRMMKPIASFNSFNGPVPSFFAKAEGFSEDQLRKIIWQCFEQHFKKN